MSGATTLERAELREMAREIATRELIPRSAALDGADAGAPADCWRTLAAVGLDRAVLGEEHGGAGLGVEDLMIVLEELAVGDGGMALSVLLSNVAFALISPEQLDHVPEGARWALAAARLGSDLTLSEGRLDGRVGFSLGAHEADGVLLVLQGPESICLALEGDTPGFAREPVEGQMGLRAAPAASLLLSALEVDPAAPGDGGAGAVAGAMALLRAGTASIARGVTRRAFAMALCYAHERRQGGKTIVEYDAVADMLAPMAAWLTCPLAQPTGGAQALALKIQATDAAVAATTDAVQVFGGTGYMQETAVEKLMRDAKYCQLYPEPNWLAQDELVHLQHKADIDLLAWPSAMARAGSTD